VRGARSSTTSRAQQRAELAARAIAHRATASASGLGETTQAIDQDTGCAIASLWIFDQVNRTGNEIWFSGAGGTFLSDDAHWVCTTNWECYPVNRRHQVRSYWAGSELGHFSEDIPPGSFTPFAAHEQLNVADPVVPGLRGRQSPARSRRREERLELRHQRLGLVLGDDVRGALDRCGG
jgi:hypothetical protein